MAGLLPAALVWQALSSGGGYSDECDMTAPLSVREHSPLSARCARSGLGPERKGAYAPPSCLRELAGCPWG